MKDKLIVPLGNEIKNKKLKFEILLMKIMNYVY